MICRLPYRRSTKAVWKQAVCCVNHMQPSCPTTEISSRVSILWSSAWSWSNHPSYPRLNSAWGLHTLWVYSILGGRSRQPIMRNPIVFLVWDVHVWFAMHREKITSTQLLARKSAVVKGYTWDSGWVLETGVLLGNKTCSDITKQVAYLEGTEWERMSSRHPLTRGCSQ